MGTIARMHRIFALVQIVNRASWLLANSGAKTANVGPMSRLTWSQLGPDLCSLANLAPDLASTWARLGHLELMSRRSRARLGPDMPPTWAQLGQRAQVGPKSGLSRPHVAASRANHPGDRKIRDLVGRDEGSWKPRVSWGSWDSRGRWGSRSWWGLEDLVGFAGLAELTGARGTVKFREESWDSKTSDLETVRAKTYGMRSFSSKRSHGNVRK